MPHGRGRTCAARCLSAGSRLPYTTGPGMPGPYRSVTTKKQAARPGSLS